MVEVGAMFTLGRSVPQVGVARVGEGFAEVLPGQP